jgi:hypothetical protein
VKVGQALMYEVIYLRPKRLTVDELIRRVVSDSSDTKEIDTATQALEEIKRSGLLEYEEDEEVVSATPAALLARILFANGLPPFPGPTQ